MGELTKVEVFQDSEGVLWKTQEEYDKALEARLRREAEESRQKKVDDIVGMIFPSWRRTTAISYQANVELAAGDGLRMFLARMTIEELEQIEVLAIKYRSQPIFGTGIKSQVFK